MEKNPCLQYKWVQVNLAILTRSPNRQIKITVNISAYTVIPCICLICSVLMFITKHASKNVTISVLVLSGYFNIDLVNILIYLVISRYEFLPVIIMILFYLGIATLFIAKAITVQLKVVCKSKSPICILFQICLLSHTITMHKKHFYDEFLRYLAAKLFLQVNVTSQRVLENYKSCAIIAEGPHANLHWAQFLETDMQ